MEIKEELRAELELLKLRIEGKIQNIVFTHKKLPFDRLSKGRRLKDLVIKALAALNKDETNGFPFSPHLSFTMLCISGLGFGKGYLVLNLLV